MWKYNGEDIAEVPDDCEGFVYKIHYRNGDYYIGKKSFWSVRRIKVKGKTRRKVIKKESDWKAYKGSSELAKKRSDILSKEIIHLCKSKACTMYYEALELFNHDVLCDPKSLNANILLKMFKCVKKDLM